MQQPWFARAATAKREIDLAQPPREVTSRAYWGVALGKTTQIAWLICAFVAFFAGMFAVDSEAVTLVEFRGPMKRTKGTVVRVYETSSSENERNVHGAEYTYEADERGYDGTSFGQSVPEPGSTVEVEYLIDDPTRSRIVGLRRRVFGVTAAIPGLIFFAVLTFAIHASVQGVRRARLLRNGRLGWAKLVETKGTGSEINDQPVIAYTFELDLPADHVPSAYRGRWQEAVKKHRFTFNTHVGVSVEDEPLEPVLYDPNRVGSGYPLDQLFAAHVTPAGGFDSTGYPAAVRFVLPVLTVVALIVSVYLNWR